MHWPLALHAHPADRVTANPYNCEHGVGCGIASPEGDSRSKVGRPSRPLSNLPRNDGLSKSCTTYNNTSILYNYTFSSSARSASIWLILMNV